MKQILSVFLLLLSAVTALAQQVSLPVELKGAVGSFIVVTAQTDETVVKWYSVDPNLNLFPPQLLRDSKIAVVTALVPGRYRLLAVSAKGDTPSDFAACTVVIGDAPLPPTPVPPSPPGPTPPNPPQPPPPTPVSAQRVVYVIRESGEQGTQFADLVSAVRNPTTTTYQYLKTKGHKVFFVDPDQRGSDGRTELESWKAKITNLANPPVMIITDVNGNVLGQQPVPSTSGDPNIIINALKVTGG